MSAEMVPQHYTFVGLDRSFKVTAVGATDSRGWHRDSDILELVRLIRTAPEREPDRDCAEGVITFGGVAFFYTYHLVEGGGDIEVYLSPKDFAERLLNAHGLTTHEPWLRPVP